MSLSGLELLGAGAAAFGAGVVNAVAGGGSLVSFPALLALGVPPVAASATNTVALCPGYLGGVIGQRRDLAGQRDRLVRYGLAAALGGLAGGALLLATGDAAFRRLVPFLLLFSCAVLGFQARLKRRFVRPTPAGEVGLATVSVGSSAAVSAASVYGGYFGAGLGIVLLAVLGITMNDELKRLNALKQWISLVVNVSAAGYFVARAPVAWEAVAVMAPAALVGGNVGGRVAGSIKPERLRIIVLTIGLAVAVVELVKRFL